MKRAALMSGLLWLSLALTLTFLVVPVLAVLTNTGPANLLSSMDDPVAIDALKLSIETTLIAVVLTAFIGTPCAWLLAIRRFKGRSLMITLIELPLVMPPAVAGIALLTALGPNSLLGGTLSNAGIDLVLTTTGVVIAITFVSAPFYLRQAVAAFGSIEQAKIDAARCLGAGEARTLIQIAVPAARQSLIAGLVLAWARALGEFGATLMFAGSFRGITQTLPLAIYSQFSVNFESAVSMSALLIVVSAAVLLTAKLVSGPGGSSGVRA